MAKLESTDPYFIRCIKPNAEKLPNEFNSELVLKQLRNTGMLETIRIRRLGYPLRMDFEEFFQRYYMLKGDLQKNVGELKDKCLLLVNHLRISNEDYQLGNTMVWAFLFFFFFFCFSRLLQLLLYFQFMLDFHEISGPKAIGRGQACGGCERFHQVVVLCQGNGRQKGVPEEEESHHRASEGDQGALGSQGFPAREVECHQDSEQYLPLLTHLSSCSSSINTAIFSSSPKMSAVIFSERPT